MLVLLHVRIVQLHLSHNALVKLFLGRRWSQMSSACSPHMFHLARWRQWRKTLTRHAGLRTEIVIALSFKLRLRRKVHRASCGFQAHVLCILINGELLFRWLLDRGAQHSKWWSERSMSGERVCAARPCDLGFTCPKTTRKIRSPSWHVKCRFGGDLWHSCPHLCRYWSTYQSWGREA
jgi:hypothetical protein